MKKNKPIKIIYDMAYVAMHPKTGLSRVAEQVLLYLAKDENIFLNLVSSKKNYYLCRKYVEKNFHNNLRINICFPNKSYFYYLVQKCIEKSSSEIDKNPIVIKSFLYRVARKTCRFLFFALEMFSTKKFIPKYVAEDSDIYFSPFDSIPEEVRNSKNLKTFLIVHDIIPILFPEYSENQKFNAMIDSLDEKINIFTVSKATKSDLIKYNKKINHNNVYTIHLAGTNHFKNCLNLERIINVKEKYGILENSEYILTVSTLEPRKNIDSLIKSFVKAKNNHKLYNTNLVLIGYKGWDYDKIFREIDNAEEFKKDIIVTGYVEESDLIALYSGALMFVFPSFYEGFGLPVLEAMQCGTPVICSNTSSLPEVGGDAVVYIDPHKEEELYNSILMLANDKNLRDELKEKGLKRAALFSWEKTVKTMSDVFVKVLEK